MDEIIKEMTTASGDIWMTFKKYCQTHDMNNEDFIAGLIAEGDQLDDKYLNSPMHGLQAHLFAGLVDALFKSMESKK